MSLPSKKLLQSTRLKRSNSVPVSPSFENSIELSQSSNQSPSKNTFQDNKSQADYDDEIQSSHNLSRDLVGAVVQMQVRNLGYPLYIPNWNMERSFLMKMTVVLSANVLILAQYMLTIHNN